MKHCVDYARLFKTLCFPALVEKVARHAYRVSDEGITAARVSGLGEDQVFEIVVCAVIGKQLGSMTEHLRPLRP